MTPRRRLFLLFVAAGIPLALPAVLSPFTELSVANERLCEGIGILLNFLLFAVALIDVAISPSLARVDVQREAANVMSVGARNAVRIWFTSRNFAPLPIEFHDEVPQPSTAEGLPFEMTLDPQKARYRVYHLIPQHRGANRFGNIFLRAVSRLGLWTFHDVRPLPADVKIYPDIQAVHGIELLARKNRVAEMGIKLSRLRGRGSEFDRLREYRREDEPRHIDWKATARQRQLIAREFVVERNQNIVIVLDCGRSMCNASEGITHLDRALNAAIVLAYVALRQGDNVGLFAASNRAERWVRPMRGANAIQTIIRSVYDLEPRYEASDYGLIVDQLRVRFRKRSLVVFLTHAIDDLHLMSITRHVRELRSPHLVLPAFLRNVPLQERVRQIPKSDVDAFQIGAAAEMAYGQSKLISDLQHSGMLALDVLPEQLTSQIVSRYLDIKARHLL
ncbi:MAG: DUF58 domain-containing protein [Planctomycetota bacterium]|nr:DUF58 domain-containing protein [Planctomycetota bacterium]